MNNIRIEIDTQPLGNDIKKLGDGLNQHAVNSIGNRGFDDIAVWARNEQLGLVGGIYAYINWNWIQICLVWIDDSLRNQGLGSDLLNSIEQIAIERGCTQAHLDTFSFQARGFYERFGYEVFGTLENYPPSQARYYMRKLLDVKPPK